MLFPFSGRDMPGRAWYSSGGPVGLEAGGGSGRGVEKPRNVVRGKAELGFVATRQDAGPRVKPVYTSSMGNDEVNDVVDAPSSRYGKSVSRGGPRLDGLYT